ncbi:hypothetical protein K461DRAFT_314319 [Myriangium duriaei CBS 260.36]|uniref:Uncharacterized protein n=1 Tax=Myriangium duriaei CBS 260.36 TaxID=1168546 RepID=A0A9P4J319_9PEZI|nr:hypothetical protein K461DRAFT_314319 [Myriangium duriaei CBS 260.36]
MSDQTDPRTIAAQAEKDLNSYQAKVGHPAGQSDSARESGVNEAVTSRFPGSEVTYGSAASGAGDNRQIPLSEGGDINPGSGQLYKARDFEGEGGPEDKAAALERDQGGDDSVRRNIR